MSTLLKTALISLLLLSAIAATSAVAPTTRYVAPGGSDSNTCTQAAPCLSLNRAYAVAVGGDTVEVAAGTYGAQSVAARSLGSAVVTFRAAAGASVTLASLSVRASYVEFDNFTLSTDLTVCPDSSCSTAASNQNYVTFRNVSGQSAFILANNVSFYGGSWGGYDACSKCSSGDCDIIDVWDNDTGGTDRVLFEGVTIHDVTNHGNGCGRDAHTDCLQFLSGTNWTVRKSKLYNCSDQAIMARPYRGQLGNFTIENNYIGAAIYGVALNMGATGDALTGTNVVRYNTIGNVGINFSSGSVSIYGNILATGSCQTGTYDYNVFLNNGWSATCGSHAKKANPAFVGPVPTAAYGAAAPNYDLQASDTVVKDWSATASYPATDIRGTARPQGSGLDAGAYEIPTDSAASPAPPTDVKATVQ